MQIDECVGMLRDYITHSYIVGSRTDCVVVPIGTLTHIHVHDLHTDTHTLSGSLLDRRRRNASCWIFNSALDIF